MIERVTSLLELAGLLALTAAVAVATWQRFGPVWSLVAVALTCFLWSLTLNAISGRQTAPTPALEADEVFR